jgi:hypothetical protein
MHYFKQFIECIAQENSQVKNTQFIPIFFPQVVRHLFRSGRLYHNLHPRGSSRGGRRLRELRRHPKPQVRIGLNKNQHLKF